MIGCSSRNVNCSCVGPPCWSNWRRVMIRKESNKTNAFILDVYTLADALLAWLFIGAALNPWFPVVVFTSGVTAAFLYNVHTMVFALRLEDK